MEKNDYTQESLADKLRIGQSTVSGWLSGTSPQRRFVKDLAEVFGVSEDWLKTGGTRNITTDKQKPHPPAASPPEKLRPTLSLIKSDTLIKNMMDLLSGLAEASAKDRRYILAELHEMLDEVDRRDAQGMSLKPLSEAQMLAKTAAGDQAKS